MAWKGMGKPLLAVSKPLLAGAVSWMVAGCNPLQLLECRDETTSAQKALLDMNDQAIDDVRRAKAAVDVAVEACRTVASEEDLGKLEQAQAQLETQIEGLLRRQSPPDVPQASPEELARLEKKGDPTCPRGQQYEHPQNQAMIRCVGPQVVEMTWEDAVAHYAERQGFSQHVEGGQLKFEYGAQVVTFHFPRAQARQPARCVEVVGNPRISWQELVARATGVQPRRLKLNQPVPGPRGPLRLKVDDSTDQAVVFLGECEDGAAK